MVTGNPQSGQNLSNNMFYMWRCIIAVAHNHADGRVTDKERAYFEDRFNSLDRAYALTDGQKKTFSDDLENPQKVSELLTHINDPSVRGQLIYFCGLLVHVNPTPDPMEEAIVQKLHDDQMSSLDMNAIRKHVNEAVASEMFQHDLAMSQLHPQHGLMGVLDHFMSRMGFDISDNYVG